MPRKKESCWWLRSQGCVADSTSSPWRNFIPPRTALCGLNKTVSLGCHVFEYGGYGMNWKCRPLISLPLSHARCGGAQCPAPAAHQRVANTTFWPDHRLQVVLEQVTIQRAIGPKYSGNVMLLCLNYQLLDLNGFRRPWLWPPSELPGTSLVLGTTCASVLCLSAWIHCWIYCWIHWLGTVDSTIVPSDHPLKKISLSFMALKQRLAHIPKVLLNLWCKFSCVLTWRALHGTPEHRVSWGAPSHD